MRYEARREHRCTVATSLMAKTGFERSVSHRRLGFTDEDAIQLLQEYDCVLGVGRA